MGKTPSRNRREYWSGENIIWISISDLSAVKSHVITNSKEHITQLAVDETGIKPIPPNTVVMSFKLSIGKVAITTKISYTNEAIIAFLPKNNINISPLYLYYSLQSYDWPQSGNRAVMGKTLNKATLKLLPFCLHAIDEQKQICAKLSLIDAAISIKTNQLVKLDKLIKSQFVSMFGNFAINDKNWYTAPLSLLGSFKNGLNFSLDKTGNQIKCLGVGDFQNNDIISYTDMSDIDLNTIPDNSYLLQDDDIVFVRSNGNKHLVGRCVCVKTDSKLATFSGFCIRFRKLTNQVDTIYLIYALKNSYIKSKIIGQGANVQNINQKTLRDVCVPIPPLKLQLEYAELIKSINKSKFVVQQSIEKLELLKKSLMQQYFG